MKNADYPDDCYDWKYCPGECEKCDLYRLFEKQKQKDEEGQDG